MVFGSQFWNSGSGFGMLETPLRRLVREGRVSVLIVGSDVGNFECHMGFPRLTSNISNPMLDAQGPILGIRVSVWTLESQSWNSEYGL